MTLFETIVKSLCDHDEKLKELEETCIKIGMYTKMTMGSSSGERRILYEKQ